MQDANFYTVYFPVILQLIYFNTQELHNDDEAQR